MSHTQSNVGFARRQVVPWGRNRLQQRRFELKYIIDEARTAAIRGFIRQYLVPDENNDPRYPGYPIHSLYLDSPGLSLCNAVTSGIKSRYKLRVRFYEESPASPVYFEIKRRVDGVILKERAKVSRPAACRLLDGNPPQMSDLAVGDPKGFAALHRFCELRDQIRARGRVLVSYDREAYNSPTNGDVRATFDRRLRARVGDREHELGLARGAGATTGFRQVVLELKFVDRFPAWMDRLVGEFDLRRCSMGKYVECVDSLGIGA